MSESRRLLQHFLASLAYRTQKALRAAPDGFGEFRAGTNVRTPHDLVWHMTGVIGYAQTMLRGGDFAPDPAAPDEWWSPDQPPQPPGPKPGGAR